MFNAGSYGITVAEVGSFTDDAQSILSDQEHTQLVNFLAQYPDAGDIIPSTGGVRKFQWRALSPERRTEARIIYYFRDLNVPLYLLAISGKGKKMVLSESDKRLMHAYVDKIVSATLSRTFRIIKSA